MKIEGKVQAFHIADISQGLSSMRVQTNPRDPNGICILNCGLEDAQKLVGLVNKFVSITIEEVADTPAAFQPPEAVKAQAPQAPNQPTQPQGEVGK